MQLFAQATAGCVETLLPDDVGACPSQKQLSMAIDEMKAKQLDNLPCEPRVKAVINSVKLPGTGAFLNSIPSSLLGLRMTSDVFTTALKYRLGSPIFPKDGPCSMCGNASDMMGDHAISACNSNGSKTRRHNLVRDALFQAASAASLAPRKEEPGLISGLDARPGDITINGWSRSGGKPKTAFDVTVVSPLAQNCYNHTVRGDSKVVLEHAVNGKVDKYRRLNLPQDIDFIPLAVTTFGAWEEVALANIVEIAAHQAHNTGKEKANIKRHLLQKLSVCIQRENAEMLIARRPELPAHVDGVL